VEELVRSVFILDLRDQLTLASLEDGLEALKELLSNRVPVKGFISQLEDALIVFRTVEIQVLQPLSSRARLVLAAGKEAPQYEAFADTLSVYKVNPREAIRREDQQACVLVGIGQLGDHLPLPADHVPVEVFSISCLKLYEANEEVLRCADDARRLCQCSAQFCGERFSREQLIAVREAQLRDKLPHVLKRGQVA
jgi:hypothetical protein